MTTSTMGFFALKIPPVPSLASLGKLFAGGLAGLLIWEIWARVFTTIVLGYPLQPAGLIDALFQHNLGISVPWLVRETMHYIVGIVGYPVAYYVISRSIPKYGLVLDVIVWLTLHGSRSGRSYRRAGHGISSDFSDHRHRAHRFAFHQSPS